MIKRLPKATQPYGRGKILTHLCQDKAHIFRSLYEGPSISHISLSPNSMVTPQPQSS